MSDIDFYADLVATGAVLGADRHWTPAELDELFDADNREYVETVSTEALNLDYGLLEYFWERESRRGAPWHGVHLSAQVHRLAIGFGDTPALLRENYGAFEPNPSFADLRAELQRRDIPLLDLPQEMPAHRSYWQPDSQAVVIEIVGQEEFVTSPTEEIGSISGISAPGLLHNLPRARFDALKQSLNHLATAEDAERTRWLDQRDPAPDASDHERAEWWRSRLTVFAIKLGWRESAEAVWVPLYLWFADQAVRRGALDPAEVARRVAESAARLELYGHNGAEDRPRLLPAAEDLTTTLLAGVPLGRVDAEQRWGVPGLHGTEVRPLLRSRQLVETAARLRPFLRDPAVIAELGEWLRVWPEFGRSAGLLEMRSD